MSQKSILTNAATYINSKNLEGIKTLLFSAKEKPYPNTVSEILQKAAEAGFWEAIREICLMNGDNQPSQFAVEHALEQAYNKSKLDQFKFICEQSLVKPSKKKIESLLNKMHFPQDLMPSEWRWKFVEYLCLLDSEEIRPSQAAIDKAFQEAAFWSRWDLVEILYSKHNLTRLGLFAMQDVLLKAAASDQLVIVQGLCSLPKVYDPELSTALIEASERGHLRVVRYLCQLKNKPEPYLIVEALRVAASNGRLNIIEFLLEPENLVKPLPKEVAEAFVSAASAGSLVAVQYFCQLKELEHKPNEDMVGKALGAAASKGHLKIIEFLLGTDNPVKSSSEDLAKALVSAASEGSLSGVDYLCSLKELKNQFDRNLVGKALGAAASKGHVPIIEFLLKLDNAVKPQSKEIVEAYVQAVCSGHVNVVLYFINLDELHLNQEQKDDLLLRTVTAEPEEPEAYTSLTFLMKENKRTPPLFSEQGLQQAWLKAKQEKKTSIRYLLEVETKHFFEEQHKDFHKEDVVKNLGAAVSEDNLPETKKLCALVGTNKLTAKVLREALKAAKVPEIKKCLLEAQKMLKLQEDVAALESYGNDILGSESPDGKKVIRVCHQLKLLVNGYVRSHFNDKLDLKENYKNQLSVDLKEAFATMSDHRAKWKIDLLNFVLRATIIGPAINYKINGQRFFTNTERQNKLQAISNTLGLGSLEPSSKKTL
jgi:ankyrin repeat protein